MRTTISIDDSLLEIAKSRAKKLGLTLGEYIETTIRGDIARRSDDGQGPPIPVFDGKTGFVPGVIWTSNAEMQKFLDKDLPIEQLR